jgi:CHASE3 domain sensor protein
MKLTVKTKLFGGFGILLILLAISAALGLNKLSGMNDRLEGIVNSSAQKVKLAARVNQNLLEISRAEKNLILSTTQEAMDAYAGFMDTAQQDMDTRREELRELSDEKGKKDLDSFEPSGTSTRK